LLLDIILILSFSLVSFSLSPLQRFSLQLDIGESAIDYSQLAKSEHLDAIEVELRKLNDKLHDIRKEQEYQKKNEQYFRDESELINARILWWSLIQAILMIGAGGYVIYNLKGFFVAKRLA
jgi:hypothetical protein